MPTSLEKILYVEDEKDIQTIAEIALKDIGGFTVKLCDSGREAIEKIAEFTPDLILLDVMMPDMDGPDTLRELRKIPAFSQTPAIFMTAKVLPDEVSALRNEGVIDVIAKPFNPMELSNQIREIWDNQ